MAARILTGFHAVEEALRSGRAAEFELLFCRPGPRAKKIIALAQKSGVRCVQTEAAALDELASGLPESAREHRGMILRFTAESPSGSKSSAEKEIEFSEWVQSHSEECEAPLLVLLLDSVTDPHNAGAILRSADQFGASLVVLPERRSASDLRRNEVVARSSAGASAWVPISVVPNLSRAVQALKQAGFWVYGADFGGTPSPEVKFPAKTAVVMGSEGGGIGRLLGEQCDELVTIPTCGKIDSLNVSVAAGVLMYEFRRQRPA